MSIMDIVRIRFLIIFISVFIVIGCKGQTYPKPKIEIDTVSYEKGIEYKIDEKISVELVSIIAKYGINRNSFLILNQFDSNQYELRYCTWNSVLPSDPISEFVKVSNRHIYLEDRLIPIVLGVDLIFGVHEFDFQARGPRIMYKLDGHLVSDVTTEK